MDHKTDFSVSLKRDRTFTFTSPFWRPYLRTQAAEEIISEFFNQPNLKESYPKLYKFLSGNFTYQEKGSFYISTSDLQNEELTRKAVLSRLENRAQQAIQYMGNMPVAVRLLPETLVIESWEICSKTDTLVKYHVDLSVAPMKPFQHSKRSAGVYFDSQEASYVMVWDLNAFFQCVWDAFENNGKVRFINHCLYYIDDSQNYEENAQSFKANFMDDMRGVSRDTFMSYLRFGRRSNAFSMYLGQNDIFDCVTDDFLFHPSYVKLDIPLDFSSKLALYKNPKSKVKKAVEKLQSQLKMFPDYVAFFFKLCFAYGAWLLNNRIEGPEETKCREFLKESCCKADSSLHLWTIENWPIEKFVDFLFVKETKKSFLYAEDSGFFYTHKKEIYNIGEADVAGYIYLQVPYEGKKRIQLVFASPSTLNLIWVEYMNKMIPKIDEYFGKVLATLDELDNLRDEMLAWGKSTGRDVQNMTLGEYMAEHIAEVIQTDPLSYVDHDNYLISSYAKTLL